MRRTTASREEGVSAYPKDVTAQMTYNFLKGGAAINVLARHHGVDTEVVDVGVDYEFADAIRLAQLQDTPRHGEFRTRTGDDTR